MKKFIYIFYLFFVLNFSFTFASNEYKNMSSIENKKKFRFIINPNSGTKTKDYIIKTIEKDLDRSKFNYEISYTKAAKHATELAKEAKNLKYDLVVAIGGDGTINEIGKALIDTKTIMAIIPTGSGNGLAKHLKISKNPKKAIQIINSYKYMDMDTIKINDEIFLSVAGIGFDAEIADVFSKGKKRGFLNYAKIVLKQYFQYSIKPFDMIVDGKKVTKEGFLVSFANGSQYGNDIKIAPKADISDGCFTVAILKKPSFFKNLQTLIRLRNGTINRSKYYESFKCKSLKIDQKEMIAHIDGEPIFFENGIDIKPYKKLKVLVP
ncbi:MAG: Diacylglycerol kinase [Candidatus Anoxychlamydiales bacterium]|nr:Diacylglycerol kinase [Candidatus Anoxychlamydiales bacterium]